MQQSQRFNRWLGLACLAITLLAEMGGAWAQGTPGSVFTVAKVAVTAEAADAVEAKQLAIVKGQQDALQALFRRLTGFAARNRLPQLDADQVDRMIAGMQVRNERNSGTIYLAQLDFNFRADAVKDILNRFGVAFVTDRAPEVLVVPVFVQDGALVADGNPWREALMRIDGVNALAPLKIVPPLPGMNMETVKKIIANPAEGLETVGYQYRAQYLVFAVADVSASTMKLRLTGRDATGIINLERPLKGYAGDLNGGLQTGAKLVLNVFEGRWKVGRLAAQGALGGPQELAQIELTAQFAGLKEWRVIKDRLEKLPGVQGLDIRSVNPRGASIALEFPGGGERLARAAQAYGLTVEGSEGAWLVRAQ